MALEKEVQIQINAKDNASAVFKKFQNTAGIAMMAVGGAVTAAFGFFVKTAADFEDSMRKVMAISGATEEQFMALTEVAKEMGATTRFKASQAAEALFYLAQAGFTTEEMLEVLPRMLDLAAASGVDLGLTTDVMTDIMQGYGMTVKDVAHINDVLTYAFTHSNATLEMLYGGMKFIGPVAKQLGWDFEETAAGLVALADAGFKGSMGGTALRQIAIKLIRTNSQLQVSLGDYADELEMTAEEEEELTDSLGKRAKVLFANNIQVLDSAGNLKGLAEIIGELSDATLSQSELVDLFGARMGQIGYLTDFSKESIEGLTEEMKNCDGITQKTATTMESSFSGGMRQAKSATEGLMIALGDELLPVLAPIIDKVTAIVRWIVVWAKENPVLFNTLVRLGFAVGVLTLGVGTLMFMLPKLKMAMIAVKVAATSMWGAITLGVSLAILGVMELVMHWEDVVWFFKGPAARATRDLNREVENLADTMMTDLGVAADKATSDLDRAFEEQKRIINNRRQLWKDTHWERMAQLDEQFYAELKAIAPEKYAKIKSLHDRILELDEEEAAARRQAAEDRAAEIEEQLETSRNASKESRKAWALELAAIERDLEKKDLFIQIQSEVEAIPEHEIDTHFDALLDEEEKTALEAKAIWSDWADDFVGIHEATLPELRTKFFSKYIAMMAEAGLAQGVDIADLDKAWSDYRRAPPPEGVAWGGTQERGLGDLPSRIPVKDAGGLVEGPGLFAVGKGVKEVIREPHTEELQSSGDVHIHVGYLMGDDVSLRKFARQIKQILGEEDRRTQFGQVNKGYFYGRSSI